MPNTRDQKIQTEAKRLLKDGVVDVVIGFKKGTLPYKMQPCFIQHADQVDLLEMNGLCSNNLAVYLNHRPKGEKTAIVCRGCESRAIQTLVLENRHARENLYLIGVPCIGILDLQKIEKQEPILAIQEEGDQVRVTVKSGEKIFKRNEVLHSACLNCNHPQPTNIDMVIDEAGLVEEKSFDKSYLESFRGLTLEERYQEFSKEAERCIRCYACREACPMCYCEECFVNHSRPQWIDSTIDPAGQQAWHIIRAFHQTGRCVSCGACERACPMNIKMTYLTDLLNQDMFEEYGFEPGLDPTLMPPFLTLSQDEGKFANRQEGDHAD
ncbi:MAG: 4Fe-4S dicluster domain-containing protein [Anaerolineaceae bacterium]